MSAISPPTSQPDVTIPEYTGWRSWLDNERFLAMLMLLPAVIYIIVLVGFPFIMAILYSFSDITVASPRIDRLTLETFQATLGDKVFRTALWNTLLFSVVSQVIVIILGNILALALLEEFRGRWLVRLLILLPWATPIAISALMWWLLLDNVNSPIDWMFRQVGLLGQDGVISNANNMYWRVEYARLSVILIYVWRILPMSTVILLAGLTSIPKDVKDAVAIDGVGFWTEFFEVTVPLLRPVLLVAFLFGVIFTFGDMTVIYVVTQGGPTNATQVLPSWAYYQGIEGGSLAEGAATAIFMLPVLFGVALILLRTARRSEVN
ncbi:MAG: sugar ABC transporter permease [Chloroflexota bacterium]